MKIRTAILLLLFILAGFMIHHSGTVEPVHIKRRLAEFPRRIGEWRVDRAINSSEAVVKMLGVTDYVNYNYVDPQGRHVDLYVGYYHAVGVDGAYHSPKNCLPGGGWGIAAVKEVELNFNNNFTAEVTEMIIQNGAARQVVIYWYQNRGRIIASEYWEKVYLVLDALLMHRRDGAFVRIMAYSAEDDLSGTEAELKKFSCAVLNTLKNYLPGKTL